MDPLLWSELFAIADAALRAGFEGGRAPAVAPDSLPAALRAPSGVFVTVEVDGELNGCIGVLEPEPLGPAVARLAWDAAFADPRLPRLRPEQHDRTTIKISVLGPLEPLEVDSVTALIEVVRPEVDGLLIEDRDRRATFLPAVWRHGLDPASFVRQLLVKAGLPGWSASTSAWRYTTDERSAEAKDVPHHLAALDLDGADRASDA